jgi:hypothetical protein
MFFCPRGKKSHFTPYNQGVKLLIIPLCPRIEFRRGKTFLFLVLRKNFRGITFFASFETPISVIKI